MVTNSTVKYIISERSFKDLLKNIYICKEKPSRTFEFRILVFNCAQNTNFLGTFADCSWSGQNFLLNCVFYGRSWKDNYGNIYICKERPSRTFEFWILVFICAQNTYFLGTFADCSWSGQNFLLNYVYYVRSWKDEYGNIYICNEKPFRTFKIWILVFNWAQNSYFLGIFVDCLWPAQNFRLDNAYYGRS